MYVGGEDWVIMRLCVHVCTPELTQDTNHLLSKTVSVCGLSLRE